MYAAGEGDAAGVQIVMLTVYEDSEQIFTALAAEPAATAETAAAGEVAGAIRKCMMGLADVPFDCAQSGGFVSKAGLAGGGKEPPDSREEMVLDCLARD